MTVVQINGKLPWKCFRSKPGSWIAVCDLLKVTIEADTWALLMQDIGESVNTIFKDLFESDQLDHFLRVQEWQSAGSCRPVRDIYTSTFRLCQASSTPKHTIVGTTFADKVRSFHRRLAQVQILTFITTTTA